MWLGKGKVATMTIVNFLQKVRQALVPMCQATIDALLLGTLIIIILNYAGIGILFTYAASIYVLVYLIALVVWLRKTARDARVADGLEHSSDVGRVFYEGMGEPLQTPYPQNNSR
jgi:hypothetical protein